MTFSYPHFGNNELLQIFRNYPLRASLILQLMTDVMAPSSELSSIDRELIFAYTSYQNACHFCFESHLTVASSHGLDGQLFQQIFDDLDSAAIEPSLRAVLGFVGKLSRSPSKVVAADLLELEAADYSEAAIVDIVSVCALAHYMNRFVDGMGVDISEDQVQAIASGTLTADNYAGLHRHLAELAS